MIRCFAGKYTNRKLNDSRIESPPPVRQVGTISFFIPFRKLASRFLSDGCKGEGTRSPLFRAHFFTVSALAVVCILGGLRFIRAYRDRAATCAVTARWRLRVLGYNHRL